MRSQFYRSFSLGLLLALLLSASASAAEDLTTWAHRSSLVFSGYTGTGALTNFPALVRLGEGIGGFSYDACRADGGDIRFSLHNGTPLNQELAVWNPEGVSEFWVRIPVLAGTQTAIAVHWGRPEAAAPAPAHARQTWSPDYVGVWHLDETGAFVRDSSSRQSFGAASSNSLPASGASGQARVFDPATKTYARIASSPVLFPSSLTYECWFKRAAGATVNGVLMGNFYDWNNGLFLCVTPDGKLMARYSNGAVTITPAPLITAEIWHHVALTFSGGATRVFLDGAQVYSATDKTVNWHPSRPDMLLGWVNPSDTTYKTYYLNGALDEVRMSSSARPPDYAAAVFRNVASNAIFQAFTDTPAGTLTIAGNLETPFAATPPYGVTGGYSSGDPLSCSAPAAYDDATTGTRYVCTGYTVHADGALLTQDSGTSYSGTFPAGVRTVTVTWLWTRSYQMTFSAGDNGTVSPAGSAWYPEGTNVTVTASPTNALLHSFYAWAGNCPTTRIFNASVTLPADQSRTLSAAFGLSYFVKTNGNDSADGRSIATAKLTLQAAIDTAAAGDTVWIDDGTYTFTSGDYGAVISKSLAIRSRNGAEAVILSGNDARRLLNLNAPGAVAVGLTLKNGYSISSQWNLPSAVLLTRGHLLDCVLDGNRGTSANNDAIRLVSGWISGCVIRNGRTTGTSGGRNASIGLLGEGLVEDCVITNNAHRKNGFIGAAVYLENARSVVRNSLIAGNTSLDTAGNTAKGAGVYFAAAGRTENCSIANNRVNGFGGGVYIAGGLLPILVDNIVSGNSATAGGNDIYGQKSLFGYSCSADLANGEGGNTSADPRFTDAASGDFRLESISPARNTGYNLLWNDLATATDLGGMSRVAEVRVDMGAYELSPTGEEPLACTFLAEPTTGLISLTPTFTASVGGNTSGLIYTWRFGDGAITNGPDLGTVAHTYAPGYYTVTLAVTNALNQHAEVADVDLIKVIPQTAYVATNGLHIAPFVSWTQAATNVESAVAVGSPEVEVAAGRFEVPAGVNLALTRAVHVRGAGPGRTILDAKSKKSARIWMTHANAVLEGMTCRGGNADWNIGAILDLDNGTVTNCVFTECATVNSGAIRMTLGRMSDCVIRNTTSLATINQTTWGVGLHVLGAGRVERTIVTNNVCANYRSNGAGIRVDTAGGAVIRNCLIASNHNVPPAANEVAGGAGIYLGVAATVENCTITANQTGGSGGGLYVGNASATLRNNIIFANIATNSHYASPKQDVHDATGTALFTACCSSDLSGSGNGNLAVDPRFKDAGARDYTLNSRSPCMNKGIDAEWMTAEAIDLAGNPRIRERRPDIGCYEGLSPGGTLLLFR